MPGYRFYFVNRAGGIESARESECDDDRHAESFAHELLLTADSFVHSVEGWERARIVCRVSR